MTGRRLNVWISQIKQFKGLLLIYPTAKSGKEYINFFPLIEILTNTTTGRSMTGQLKFINERIEEDALKVTYDPTENSGKVIYNISLIKSEDLDYAIDIYNEAFHAGLCLGDRVSFSEAGSVFGDYAIPEGHTGIITICSLTLDALLYRKGVPLNPIGGGLVEIKNMVPRRFTAMIRYEATTIDPISVMISHGTTSVMEVIHNGKGTITANLRECHMEAEPSIFGVLDDLNDAGFSGVLEIGVPNTSILGVPVTPNYTGIAMVGGTNPAAAILETGRWVEINSMKGLIDISEIGYLSDY